MKKTGTNAERQDDEVILVGKEVLIRCEDNHNYVGKLLPGDEEVVLIRRTNNEKLIAIAIRTIKTIEEV